MLTIDGHLHLIQSIAGSNGKGRLNALGNGEAIWDDGTKIQLMPPSFGDTSFTAEVALDILDAHNIQKAVLMQGSLNGYQNYYSYLATIKYPDRFVSSFAVDPFAQNSLAIVKHYIEELGVRILKLEISQAGGLTGFHMPFSLDTDPKCRQIFHFLSDYAGATVVIDYGDPEQLSYQPESIATLASRYPQLNFVVCHLSFPNADHLERLANALLQWQELDNIYTDLSAIQDIENDSYPFLRCQKDVSLAKDILGAKRLIWGSDAPLSAVFNDYEVLATWLKDSNIFTPKELQDVMYNNALAVYFKSNDH